MASVTYEHVTKTFDGTVAVKDLSLEVRESEFIVLVGPSGCGKSTALRMLAGLERVDEGRILIGDEVVNNVAPAARDVAMVFQSYALYPHMTVYDNLAFGLRNQGVPRREIDERVRRAGEILQLSELLKRKPKQLSGGQRQRVALGRAIVREPVVFLMDEPLSNLDAKLRLETRAEILQLQRRLGTTTVYVTHDQVEAMTMGDRIAVLRDGVLQQVGTPAGGVRAPAERLRRRLHRRAGDELRAGRADRRSGHHRADRRLPPRARPPRRGRRRAAVREARTSSSTSETSSSSTSWSATAPSSPSCPSSSASLPATTLELSIPENKLYLFDAETELAIGVTEVSARAERAGGAHARRPAPRAGFRPSSRRSRASPASRAPPPRARPRRAPRTAPRA